MKMKLESLSLLDQIDPLGMELRREETESERLPKTNASFEMDIKDEPLQEIDTEMESLVIQPEVFICHICTKFFTSKTALNEHESKNHAWSKLPFCCQHCKFGTKKKVLLQKHILFKHILAKCKKIKCKICNNIMLNSLIQKKKKRTVKHKKDKYAVCDFNVVDGVVNIISSVEESTIALQEISSQGLSVEANTSAVQEISSQVLNNLSIVSENEKSGENSIHNEENVPEIEDNCSDVGSCNDVWDDSHGIADNASDREENLNNIQEKTKHIKGNELACKICNREFRNRGTLEKHIKNMHSSNLCSPINENSKVSCDICHIYVNTKHTLEKHIQNRHLNQNFASQMSSQTNSQNCCLVCNKKFQSVYSMRRHVANIHKKQVNANKIMEFLNSKAELNDLAMNSKSNHEINIKNKTLKCKFCNKPFKQLNLENHIKIHDTDFPTCKFCCLVFENEDFLNKHVKNLHLKVNTENNIEILDENTKLNNYQFLDKNTEIIENTNNGIIIDNVFRCKICNISVVYKVSLKKHMKRYHDTIPYFDCIVNGVPYRDTCDSIRTYVDVNKKKQKSFTSRKVASFKSDTIIKNKQLKEKSIKKVKENSIKKIKESSIKKAKENRIKVQILNDNTEITFDNVKAVVENGICICKLCDKMFASKYNLKRHMKYAHESQHFDYIIKDKIYRETYTKLNLKNENCDDSNEQNINTENEQSKNMQEVYKKFSCTICNKRFRHGNSLKKHKQNIHFIFDNNKIISEKKESSYFDKFAIRDVKVESKISCKFCSFIYFLRKPFIKHLHKDHFKPNNIKLFEEITPELEAKIIKHTKKKSYMCNMCERKFKKKSIIKKHIIEAHLKNGWTNGKQFFCEICNKTFAFLYSFNKHMKIIHPVGEKKLLKCDKCDFKSIHISCVRTHNLRVHLRGYIHICKICKKRFSKKKVLHSHMDFEHPNSRVIFTCGICNGKFDGKSILKQHIFKSHATEKPFLCHLCPKSFAIQSLLNAHIKYHESEFCCEVCGRIFKSKYVIRLHLESHAKIPKVFCDFCQKGFRRKEGMVKHYLAFHAVVKKPRKRRTVKTKK